MIVFSVLLIVMFCVFVVVLFDVLVVFVVVGWGFVGGGMGLFYLCLIVLMFVYLDEMN